MLALIALALLFFLLRGCDRDQATTPTDTGAARPTGNGTATSTGSVEFTGAASADNVAGGVMAIVFGAVALAL